MHDLFPNAMFVTRRALCPGCGAPLSIADAPAQVKCGYCGSLAVIERRLREMEPELKPDRKTVKVEWVPSHLNPGTAEERATCWGCGASLLLAGRQGIVRCANCGCESKIERRMRQLEAAWPGGADEGGSGSLIDRILKSTDLAEQVTLAQEFDGWAYIHEGTARRIGDIMGLMQTCDPRLAHALGEAVGKLLCEGKVMLRDAVVRAAEKHTFNVKGSRALLWQIGLGGGVCMKVLLDTADYAVQQGALEYGCTALWAANTLLGRNYPEHPILGQIILYRMIYLRGAALAWALRFAQGQGGLGFRYPTATILQFIDDCAAERPALVPEIRKAIYEPGLANESEYRARLELMQKLATVEARDAALRVLPAPPKGTSLRLIKAALDMLLPLLDDAALGPPAIVALTEFIESESGVPPAIHALVKARGNSLPEDFRRAYLKRVPDSRDLAPLPPKYWQPTPEEKLAPELAEAARLYDEGLRRAVDEYNRETETYRRYTNIIQGRSPLMAAAGKGDVKTLRDLLGSGADANETNPFGRTALMFAAESDHLEAVRELLTRGADPKPRDKDRNTAFMLAAGAGHRDLVASMLELAPGDADHLQEAFRTAFHARHVEVMRLLLEKGADPDIMEGLGQTPLIIASGNGWIEMVRLLLFFQAQAEHQDAEGKTALDRAVAGGHTEVSKLLSHAK